ncbi:MAG: putative membrane protein required for colicin V production [Planctomycetota bacterium]|jgi:uncharacterized membrane protein required for colicin V production
MNPIEAAPKFWHALRDLAWVDQLGLGLLALFLVLGFWRGLWWQIIRLAGVGAAVLLARSLTPDMAPEVEIHTNLSSAAAHGLVWFVLFTSGLILASVAGLMGKRALDALALGWVDRFGGALAGGLTGMILHGAVLLVFTSLGTTDWSANALGGTRSQRLLNVVTNRWPILVDAKVSNKIVGPWAKKLGLERPEGSDPSTLPLPQEARDTDLRNFSDR